MIVEFFLNFIDGFLPKLRTFPKSSMVLSKSAIVLMPARFKQLYARTESSNSSMEIFAGPSSTAGSSLSEPTGSTTIPPSPVFTSTTSAECANLVKFLNNQS